MNRSDEDSPEKTRKSKPARRPVKTVARTPVPQPGGRTLEYPNKTISKRLDTTPDLVPPISKTPHSEAKIRDITGKTLSSSSRANPDNASNNKPESIKQGTQKNEHREQQPRKRITPRNHPDRSSLEGQATSNRLLDEASSLLALGGFLLESDKPNNLDRLHTEILDAVSRYENSIHEDYDTGTVDSASFCICAFIDDCVLRTPWGPESPWSERSILATLHGQAQRHLLATQIEDKIRNDAEPDLFALYHTVFSLGYQGMAEKHDLSRMRTDVYRKIKSAGHIENIPLVSHSMIQAREGEPLARRLPWWTVLATAIALALLVYWAFWILQRQSVDTFYNAIGDNDKFKHEQLGPQDFFPESPPVPIVQQAVDIRQLLLDQGVSENDFRLVAADPGTRIVLPADDMFRSGSPNLETRFLPILQSISRALAGTSGQIIVEGHTDNVPFAGGLRTNRTLSEDRSNVVSEVISRELDDSDRLLAKGRADLSPIVCNDSSENRNRNRRVELVLPDVKTFGAERRPPPVCNTTG